MIPLTFNLFRGTVSNLFAGKKEVRKLYQILNSLPLCVSLTMILPVSHQPDCSKTVTSQREALMQITNLRKDALITEVYSCERKREPPHTTSQPGSLTNTIRHTVEVWFHQFTFTSCSFHGSCRSVCIRLLECNGTKTQGMDRLEVR